MNSSDGTTTALIRLGGRKVLIELERLGPQQIGYGYAITVPKGQGETVDKVLSFHYVKPGEINQQNVLASVTGTDVTAEVFSRWNTTLTDSEKGYLADTVIGGHPGTLSFIMLSDSSLDTGEQKGIAVRFSCGQEVTRDESVRLQMRDAGMYWAPEAGVWVTAATNREFLSLPGHPLRDPSYLAQLKNSLSPGAPPPFPPPVHRSATTARSFKPSARRSGSAGPPSTPST